MFTSHAHYTHFTVSSDPIVIQAEAVLRLIESSRRDGYRNKLRAIKSTREIYGIGLKDAKEIVETVATDHSIHFGGGLSSEV